VRERPGAVVHKDSASGRMLLFLRIATWVPFLAASPLFFLPGISGPYFFFSLLVTFAVLDLWYSRLFGVAKVHANGVTFPRLYPTYSLTPPTPQRRRFVRFYDMTWLFHDPARPLLGLRVGARSGSVWIVSTTDVHDLQSFVLAIGDRIPRVAEDPWSREVARLLDASPGSYARLWGHSREWMSRPAVCRAMLFVGYGNVESLLAGVEQMLSRRAIRYHREGLFPTSFSGGRFTYHLENQTVGLRVDMYDTSRGNATCVISVRHLPHGKLADDGFLAWFAREAISAGLLTPASFVLRFATQRRR